MKKILIGSVCVIAAAIILIILFTPASNAKAIATMADYEKEGTIIRKYNGDSSEVVIPTGITEIGPGCFKESSVTAIVIPGYVKKIDDMAFYGCDNLREVVIEKGVKSIGVSAFANCKKLSYVSVPDTVERIEPGVFATCNNLSSLDFDNNNEDYFYNDGVLYNKDSTRLVQYLAGRPDTGYIVPFTVKDIDRYAFFGAQLLTDVRLSNNIAIIPDYAFSNCVGLTYIFVPESVKKIGSYAFSDCVNLSYVAMERSDVDIASNAFSNCAPSLKASGGVTEAESLSDASRITGRKINLKKISGSASENGDVEYADEDEEESGSQGDAADIGEGKETQKEMRKNALAVPLNDIDTSDPNLVGATKVSGGRAFVIPENDGKVSYNQIKKTVKN